MPITRPISFRTGPPLDPGETAAEININCSPSILSEKPLICPECAIITGFSTRATNGYPSVITYSRCIFGAAKLKNGNFTVSSISIAARSCRSEINIAPISRATVAVMTLFTLQTAGPTTCLFVITCNLLYSPLDAHDEPCAAVHVSFSALNFYMTQTFRIFIKNVLRSTDTII
jgi:hypothetical protein